jgi:hypothetical protein
MMLLPANVMTMVMYAFRAERKHITESEERFRNAMEYSAIGMALVSIEGSGSRPTKRCAISSVTARRSFSRSPSSSSPGRKI